MDWCLVAGPLISWVVQMLKRLPFVAAYPKLIALILSMAAAGVAVWFGEAAPTTQLIRCVLETWAASIATHEVITKSMIKVVKLS